MIWPFERRDSVDMCGIVGVYRKTGGHAVWDAQLWLLLNFELWHRINLDGDPA
jgi:hypothetical protein